MNLLTMPTRRLLVYKRKFNKAYFFTDADAIVGMVRTLHTRGHVERK